MTTFAVLADVHANLEALFAVMADIDAEAPGAAIVHCGDVVGYGPQPNEVIDLLRARRAIGVLGNHDARAIDHIAVDDCGRILNPLLVDGQVHGGLGQGIAQALYEEVRYDELGTPLTGNFATYPFPAASELPSWRVAHTETPTPLNPLGAKGIGESATVGSTPAVQNAVVDALAHLGVRHVDIPLTPERVLAAIRAAAG